MTSAIVFRAAGLPAEISSALQSPPIVIATSGYWGGIILKVFNIIVPFLLAFVLAYILNPFVKNAVSLNLFSNTV